MFAHGGPCASLAGDAAGAANRLTPNATSASTSIRFISLLSRPGRSLEVEVGLVLRAVRQGEREDVAAGRERAPRGVRRRPVVDELVRACVVTEDGPAGGKRHRLRSERLREGAVGALVRHALDGAEI